MAASLTHSASVVVAASPERVYATVSDVTRTGEWSPECRECWWDAGDGPRVGARFTGRNVTPERTWETRCEVVAAEPGRAFAWSVSEGNVIWGYELRAVDGGTELTETWEFTPKGQEFFARKYGAEAPARIADRHRTAVAGIPETLAALRRVIERG